MENVGHIKLTQRAKLVLSWLKTGQQLNVHITLVPGTKWKEEQRLY